MRFEWKTLVVGLGCALLVGCANKDNSCGGKILALQPNEAGEFTFQPVQLATLSNPYELSGGAAKIYFESLIGGNGFAGKVAEPKYTKAGGVCVPMDAASSMAVSLYAQFEKLMMFETRIGTLDMLSWPRKVGLDIHVKSTEGMTHNNAHYFGAGDAIAVLPYNLQGLPLALNPGIMAHEHFHGHFQRQVISVTNASLTSVFDIESLFYGAFNLSANVSAKPTVDDVEAGDMRTPRGLNAFVLRAWNEGLADLYGGIFSKNPRFFTESLPSQKDARALTAPVSQFISAANLKSESARFATPKEFVGISYQQGAILARLMYRLAQSGVESEEAFLVRIMRRLKDIPAAIVGQYDSRYLEFEEILPVLLKDFPMDQKACNSVFRAISKEARKKGLPQCAGFSI